MQNDYSLYQYFGPSGCCKTTLLRVIAGLDEPSSGEIRLEGQPIRGPGPERGMVFQEYSLYPLRTVLDNVAFGPELKGIGKRKRNGGLCHSQRR